MHSICLSCQNYTQWKAIWPWKKLNFYLFSVLSHLFKTCRYSLPMRVILSIINYIATQILECCADIDDSRWWMSTQKDTACRYAVNNWIPLVFCVKVIPHSHFSPNFHHKHFCIIAECLSLPKPLCFVPLA